MSDPTTESPFVRGVRELYNITAITPEFWDSTNHNFVESELLSFDHGNSDELRELIAEHPAEVFWTEFFKSYLAGDIITKMQCLKCSADNGNPFAAYSYAQILLKNDFKTEALKYVAIGCTSDYYKCILLHINITTNNSIREHLHRLDTDDRRAQQGAELERLVGCARKLERWSSCYDVSNYLSQIYSNTHRYDYPCPADEVPYQYRAHLYNMMSGEDEDTETSIEICEKYMALFKEFRQMQILKTQSLEDVCKSIIIGYMV